MAPGCYRTFLRPRRCRARRPATRSESGHGQLTGTEVAWNQDNDLVPEIGLLEVTHSGADPTVRGVQYVLHVAVCYGLFRTAFRSCDRRQCCGSLV